MAAGARVGALSAAAALEGGGTGGALLIVELSLLSPAPGLITPALLTVEAVSEPAIGAPEPAPVGVLLALGLVLAGMFGSEPLESDTSPPFEQLATNRLDAARTAPVASSAVRQVVEFISPVSKKSHRGA